MTWQTAAYAFHVFVWVVWIPGCCWLIFAINETGRQTRALLAAVPYDESFWELFEGFCSVSFDRHLLAVATFRDPFKLYPPQLVACLNSKTRIWAKEN